MRRRGHNTVREQGDWVGGTCAIALAMLGVLLVLLDEGADNVLGYVLVGVGVLMAAGSSGKRERK
jgi:hypothetical protein